MVQDMVPAHKGTGNDITLGYNRKMEGGLREQREGTKSTRVFGKDSQWR